MMKRLWLSFIVTLAVVLTLGACAQQSPAPAPSTKPVPPATAPVPGGTLKVVLTSPANNFGYPPQIGGSDRDYCPPFFNRLLLIDGDGSYKPELATSWEISADGKTITFKLRQGVKFHDGTDFNAQAVKFNLDSIIPPKKVTLKGVTSIDAVDPYTVKINLDNFNNLILYQLAANYECYMASPTAIQKNGIDWATKNPVGTGPFKFVSYERSVQMKMVKNPDYWEKGLPYLDAIQIDIVGDAMTQLTSFKAGNVNVIYDPNAITIASQLRDEGYPIFTANASMLSLSFDTKASKIFADKRVREAIEYAIDKEAICSGPGRNVYKPLYQVVLSTSKSYNPDSPPRKYDPEKAKKLLAEAGYPNGFSCKYTQIETYWRDGLVAMQSYLSKVGIKLDFDFVTMGAFITKVRASNKLDADTIGQMPMQVYSSDLFNMDLYFRSDSGDHSYVVKPTGSDDLIAKAKLARDQDGMFKITRDISKLIYDDVTVVPLWMNPRTVVMDKSVQNHGWFINNDSGNNRFGFNTWLKK